MTSDRSLLVVCTGNICRSAYLHYRLQQALEPLGEAAPRIFSRGTYVYPGLRPPHELLAVIPAGLAGRLHEHRPQQLQDQDVRDASLILAAAEEHLDDALRRAPYKTKQGFTVAEFAASAELGVEAFAPALDGRGPEDRLEVLREFAFRHRSRVRSELAELSMADPYGLGAEDYQSMVADADRYVQKIAEFMLSKAVAPPAKPMTRQGSGL